MKKILFVLLISLFLIPSVSSAVKVTLEDGTEISTDGLSETEKQDFIKYLEKVNNAKQKAAAIEEANSTTQAILDTAKDPEKLDQWRKLITGTIKDVCNDLNVTVNDFVQTPVGLGVAAFIFYKVAGADIFSSLMDIIIVVPFFFLVLSICLFLTWKFLGHTTERVIVEGTKIHNLTDKDLKEQVKKHISDSTNDKFNVSIPVRVCRYKWNSNEARTAFSIFMVGIPIVFAIVCLVIAL